MNYNLAIEKSIMSPEETWLSINFLATFLAVQNTMLLDKSINKIVSDYELAEWELVGQILKLL